MGGKYEASGSGKRSPVGMIVILVLVLALAAVGGIWAYNQFGPGSGIDETLNTAPSTEATTEPSTEATEEITTAPTEETTEATTEPPTEPEPEPLTVVSTATITSTGDILMHANVINTGKQSDGSYDFTSIFRYVTDYTSAADYMVGNLETTLCGLDNGYKYSGFPKFNCPDAIVESAKAAGFDMLLTANNHCYDTSTVGLLRTVNTIEEYGLDVLGTRTSADGPKYSVVDINGIQIGIACYTYGTISSSGTVGVNGLITSSDANGLINVFDYDRLDSFYEELSQQITDMKEEGAEAIVLYIHWGNEYYRKPNSYQTSMAQEICDMGVDVIIGGHPHVIQPMDLLTSTVDENHKTVCLYSMGNAVSNQRLGNVSASKTAHTEDGVLFTVTFARYSDGTVALDSTDLIPCWVNMHTTDGVKEYNILPLDPDTQDQWQTLYGLTTGTYKSAVNSYDRTMELVGEGLEECQTYLAEARAQREADYLAAQMTE